MIRLPDHDEELEDEFIEDIQDIESITATSLINEAISIVKLGFPVSLGYLLQNSLGLL
jgi:hypothetical protein